jgi:hypothetical protein
MYAVVEFLGLDDQEFEVVPSNWISADKKTCAGPKNHLSWQRCLQSQQNPKSDWVPYPVKLVGLYGMC